MSTTYHRDVAVTTWDVYRERWIRARKNPSAAVIALIDAANERNRVLVVTDHALANQRRTTP